MTLPKMEELFKKTFTRFEDATKEVVKYIKACLMIGGIPQLRTKYAGMVFREDGYIGVMAICYGRADYLPREYIFAPETDEKWREFIKFCEEYFGDYRVVLRLYGHMVTDEEVRAMLERILPKEVIERLAKMPVWGIGI